VAAFDFVEPSKEATKQEMTEAIDRFKIRTPDYKISSNPDKMFDNETIYVTQVDGDIVLTASKNTGVLIMNWFSSTRIMTDDEARKMFQELKDRAQAKFGPLPIGGVYGNCPYASEHGAIVNAQATKLLAELWGPDTVILAKAQDVSFPLYEKGVEIGAKVYPNVLLYYMPTGRIEIGN
jgi:hypothetical protein